MFHLEAEDGFQLVGQDNGYQSGMSARLSGADVNALKIPAYKTPDAVKVNPTGTDDYGVL